MFELPKAIKEAYAQGEASRAKSNSRKSVNRDNEEPMHDL
jgi:hypothetical protein